MAIGTPVSLGAHAQAASTTNVLPVSGSSAVAGSLIVVFAAYATVADTLTGVADSQGNTYTVLDNFAGTAIGVGCAYCSNSAFSLTGVDTITATFAGSVSSEIEAVSVSGANGGVDKSALTQSGLAATAFSGNIASGTLAVADEVLFGFTGYPAAQGLVSNNGGAAFTQLVSVGASPRLYTSYLVVAATTTQNFNISWPTANNYAADLISFKITAAGLPAGTLYDLTIPRPLRRMSMLADTQQQRAEYIPGKEKLPNFIPNLDRPQPWRRALQLSDPQNQYVRIIGQESGFTKFVPDLSIPPPVRRQRTLDNPQAQRAQYIPGKETLPGFVPDLSLPQPPAKRLRTLDNTQQQRAEYIIGRETLPGFTPEWRIPPERPRLRDLTTWLDQPSRILLLIGQDLLPKFNAEWKIPPRPVPARELLGFIKDLDIQLIGQDQTPNFTVDWSIPRRPGPMVDLRTWIGLPVPSVPAALVILPTPASGGIGMRRFGKKGRLRYPEEPRGQFDGYTTEQLQRIVEAELPHVAEVLRRQERGEAAPLLAETFEPMPAFDLARARALEIGAGLMLAELRAARARREAGDEEDELIAMLLLFS